MIAINIDKAEFQDSDLVVTFTATNTEGQDGEVEINVAGEIPTARTDVVPLPQGESKTLQARFNYQRDEVVDSTITVTALVAVPTLLNADKVEQEQRELVVSSTGTIEDEREIVGGGDTGFQGGGSGDDIPDRNTDDGSSDPQDGGGGLDGSAGSGVVGGSSDGINTNTVLLAGAGLGAAFLLSRRNKDG